MFTSSPHAFGRLRMLSDPVLRTIAMTSGVNMFGRSAFLTLTVLFATTQLGLAAGTVAVILTGANAIGLLTAMVAGHLADRIPTRTMLAVSMTIEGVALCAVPWVASAPMLAVVAAAFVGANRATFAARSATIAFAFTSGGRADSRAIIKMANNASVALGSTAAALPVALATPEAYRVAFAVAGGATLTSAVISRRLPKLVAPTLPTECEQDSAAPGRSPFRNTRYLGLTVLAGLFAMQFGVAEVGLPVWVVSHTGAPHVLVTVAFTLNTVLIVVLQLPLSRGTDDVARAAKASALAGALMAIACMAYASAAWPTELLATCLLLAAVVAHTLAEILSSAGNGGLGFELADPRRAGAYQGVFAMGTSLGAMAAPAVTVAAIDLGTPGWCGLGVLFLCAGLGVRALAVPRRRIIAERPQGGRRSPSKG